LFAYDSSAVSGIYFAPTLLPLYWIGMPSGEYIPLNSQKKWESLNQWRKPISIILTLFKHGKYM